MAQPAVLITGSSGEIGHGLIKFLSAEGKHHVVAMDVQGNPVDYNHPGVEFLKGDILDAASLDSLFERFDFKAIFHLAGVLSTGAEKNPSKAQAVNVTGSFNLLERASKQSEKLGRSTFFIFPSTIAVHGIPDSKTKAAAGKVTEDQFLTPIGIYGVNKLYVEQLGKYFETSCGLLDPNKSKAKIDFRGLRFPGLLSADTIPTGGTSDYGPEMLHAAAQGKPYSCFVTAESRLPFMAMPDAVSALINIWQAPRAKLSRKVYNVTSFSVSAKEIHNQILKYFPKASVEYKPDSARLAIVESWPGELDDSAARNDWGWAPMYSLSSAFEKYLVPGVMSRYHAAKELKRAAC